MNNESRGRLRFRTNQRLHGRRAFAVVFSTRVRQDVGLLCVYSRPNELEYSRLGLSVSRRVGSAVQRNRIKRLLREAFRLGQNDWPTGYDLVVVVRPHEPLSLSDYRQRLRNGIEGTVRRWRK